MGLELLEEGFVAVLDFLKPLRRGGEKHDARLVHECVAERPGVAVGQLVPQQHVEVLDNENDAFALGVGEIHQLREGAFAKAVLVGFRLKVRVHLLPLAVLGLARQVKQGLQPKLAGRGDLIAFLREHDGIPALVEFRCSSDLGDGP